MCAGLLSGYIISSWIESFMHQYVSDALPKTVRFWQKYPRLFQPLINTHYSHHTIHHVRTFKANHVTQFRSEVERAKLSAELHQRGWHGQVILKGAFATRLAGSGALVFVSPLLLCLPFMLALLGWPGFWGALLTLMLPPFMSHFVHPYLHRPFVYGQKHAPRWLALFLASGYGRAMYRNHYMHHRYGGTSNFNLVLGADYWRRRIRQPRPKDWQEMALLGMPLPTRFEMPVHS